MDIKAIVDGLVRKYGTRDPFDISAELGLIVLFGPLVDMRGFQYSVKRRKFIFINEALDEKQRRLVCGHELAHHLLHRGINRIFMDHNTEYVMQKFENEAHRFSAELIYSDDELFPFLTRSVLDAADYMGIPVEIAKKRMESIPVKERILDLI